MTNYLTNIFSRLMLVGCSPDSGCVSQIFPLFGLPLSTKPPSNRLTIPLLANINIAEINCQLYLYIGTAHPHDQLCPSE